MCLKSESVTAWQCGGSFGRPGYLLHGEVVGGHHSRTVRLEIGSGKLWLQEGGVRRELISARPAERGKLVAYRVLIVDDSPAMRAFVRRVMTAFRV